MIRLGAGLGGNTNGTFGVIEIVYAPTWWIPVRRVGGEMYIVTLLFWERWNQGYRGRTRLGGQVRAPDPGPWGSIVVRRDRGNERVVIDREGTSVYLQRWVRERCLGR